MGGVVQLGRLWFEVRKLKRRVNKPAARRYWAAVDRIAMRLRIELRGYLSEQATMPGGAAAATLTLDELTFLATPAAGAVEADWAICSAWAAADGRDLEQYAAGSREWMERDLQTVGARLRRAMGLPPEPKDAEFEPTVGSPPLEDLYAQFERSQGRAVDDAAANGTKTGTASARRVPYSTDTDWHVN